MGGVKSKNLLKVIEKNDGLTFPKNHSPDFFVFAEILAPGQTIPFHKHDNAEEPPRCEEAGATFIAGDKARWLDRVPSFL